MRSHGQPVSFALNRETLAQPWVGMRTEGQRSSSPLFHETESRTGSRARPHENLRTKPRSSSVNLDMTCTPRRDEARYAAAERDARAGGKRRTVQNMSSGPEPENFVCFLRLSTLRTNLATSAGAQQKQRGRWD